MILTARKLIQFNTSLVGSLLHAARATRPDIAHAVGVVSKFNAAPTQTHLTAVKRIFGT